MRTSDYGGRGIKRRGRIMRGKLRVEKEQMKTSDYLGGREWDERIRRGESVLEGI